MWSKEHRKLSRRGWNETQIQAHFKEREIIEYQRYNQSNGISTTKKNNKTLPLCVFYLTFLDMQMDSPDQIDIFSER